MQAGQAIPTPQRNWSDPARYHGFTAPYNAHTRWGKTTFLYFIRHGDLVKIGLAQNIEKRLATLRAGNPEGLQLQAYRTIPAPLDRQVERRMHAEFDAFAIGREWFRDPPMPAALAAAARLKRHAESAIARWEADGFWPNE